VVSNCATGENPLKYSAFTAADAFAHSPNNRPQRTEKSTSRLPTARSFDRAPFGGTIPLTKDIEQLQDLVDLYAKYHNEIIDGNLRPMRI